MNKATSRNKLLSRVSKKKSGCWEWQGAKSGGYGCIVVERKVWWCHRLAWLLFRGKIDEGKCVCHKCDNPSCCNPDHLFVGSHGDNAKDRSEKGRGGFGEKNGNAKLTDRQVSRMRADYRAKYGDLTRLAREFEVSVDQVRKIVRAKVRMQGVTSPDWNTNAVRDRRTDISGKKIGRLEVLRLADSPGKRARSLCRCSCGTEKVMLNTNLLSGKILSCGCYAREKASERMKRNPLRLGTQNCTTQPRRKIK